MNKSKATIANKSLTILTIVILLISTLAFITPMVSATTIGEINPDSGPVGTEVRVIGTIDTTAGPYKIYWDITLVKEGTCASGSKAVNDTFTVPLSVKGSHTVKLNDPTSGTNGTTTFIVETAYYIEAVVPSPPAQTQEGDTVTIWVNMTGGEEGVVYVANVTVADPAGAVYYNVTFLNVTTALYPGKPGYGESSTVYYTDFTTGAHTNYTGTYDITFNETLATGSFFVGLTDKTEYARFEVVNIHVEGYTVEALPANVTIDIKFAGASISGYPKNVSILSGGVVDHNWSVPKGATLGTYTVTVTNATTPGTVKPIADAQDFEIVGLGLLNVNMITQPTGKQRTETVLMEFNVTYPDGSLYNVTDFQSMNVSLYYNTTFVKTIALTTANCDATTAIWNVTWKIPKDAKLGNGYNFTFLEDSIVDKEGNSGPRPVFSSESFTVSKADLVVGTINLVSPAVTNRTLTASANFNVTYPDGTYFTSTDLGWLNVTIYANSTSIANISLTPADYDSASKNWTVSWKIPWNASLGTGYNFTVNINAVEDTVTPTPNSGPTAPVSSPSFEVRAAYLTIDAIYTDKASYERDEMITVWFTATYPDGSPVTSGSANINITKVDGTQVTKTATYVTARARFEATYYITYADPLGTWNSTLLAFGLDDGEGNTGPIVERFRTFEVVKVLVYVLDIDMDVGSIHFPLEIAEFYALTAYEGVAVNASITATLYLPNGTTQSLTAVWVDTGLYKISYAIPADATGTYTLVVNGSYIIEPTTVKGIELKCFLVSPTLTEWNARLISIDAGVATIQTDVGIIKMNLTDINAKIVSVQGDVALIKTDVGTIKTDVAYIKPIIEGVNATVTSIQGDVAVIKTDVGALGVKLDALNATITDIQGDIVLIKTDIGTIKADIGTVKSLVEDMNATLVTIQGDVAIIKTDVGEIKISLNTMNTTIVSIQGDVATIKTDIGTIKADVATIKTIVQSTNTTVVDIQGDVAVIKADATTILAKLGAINATLVSLDGDVATIETEIGIMKTDLDTINATLVEIKNGLATISTKVGDIETDLTSINTKLVALNGTVATISSDIGSIQVSIEDINLKVVAINGTIATIETDVGTVKGTVTAIDGNVATIETDIGTLQTTIEDIKPVTGIVVPVWFAVVSSLIAAVFAIATLIWRRRSST